MEQKYIVSFLVWIIGFVLFDVGMMLNIFSE